MASSPSAPLHGSDYPQSYYAATAQPQGYSLLQGRVEADVCIIGGGYTGLNTAIELAQRGRSVVVLEACRVGWGASGRNGGQLIRGVGHDLDQFRPLVGEAGIAAFQRMGWEAVDIVRQRVAQFGIDCDLTWGYADLANRPQHFVEFESEMRSLQEQGYPHALELVEPGRMHEVVASGLYQGALLDAGSGHLHPLNLALGEARAASQLGVRLFENSPAIAIQRGASCVIRTPQGEVQASTLVIGCNAYIRDLEPTLSGRVLPAGSYVIATEPLDSEWAEYLIPANRSLCDQRITVDYYRLSADRRLLFGGACHYSGHDPRDLAAYMRPKMLRVFPQLQGVRIDYAWGGMIGIGANRLPQIGRLPGATNIFYAQAYAGHGLNATHLAGHLLAQAITEQESRGFELFAKVPHLTFPGGRQLRSPLLALGMAWYRLREWLG